MLSFQRTSRTRALARFVESAYAARYMRADGAWGGGDTKRAALEGGSRSGGGGRKGLKKKGLEVRVRGKEGRRINGLLGEVEGVVRRFYAGVDWEEMDRVYGAPHPGFAPAPVSGRAAPAGKLLGEEVGELESHDALIKIFARYTGEPDEDGNVIKWTEDEACKTKRNLLEAAEAERRRKREDPLWFGSSESTNWWGIKEESDAEEDEDGDAEDAEPLQKRRKLDNDENAALDAQ